MLKQLQINNIAVIDTLQIEFGRGLNALTGETGSGKSIIIDAVELLLGGRASQDSIRTGAERASVEGVFDIEGNLPLLQLLDDLGIDANEGELIIRREISANGRGRIFVNNQASTAGSLRSIQPHLVDIHGQGDQQSLVSPSSHLQLLDGYAGLCEHNILIDRFYSAIIEKLDDLDNLATEESARLQELDNLRYQKAEIEAAKVRPFEDVELETERLVLANAERLLRICGESYSQLYENENSVISAIGLLGRRLEDLTSFDSRFRPQVDQLQGLRYSLEEIAFFLRDYIEEIQVSPERLVGVEDRLLELERLKRKYGRSLTEINEYLITIKLRTEQLEQAESVAANLSGELDDLYGRYLDIAQKVSEDRKKKAKRFEKELAGELAEVALEKARFEVRLEPVLSPALVEKLKRWLGAEKTASGISRHGREDAEFFFSANPGEELRPLSDVASGGELSRLMLVIKNVGAPTSYPRTLIFDEIDAGIGGRVSDAVGLRLKRLAATNQVLCVTHQAQIARYADQHFCISKEVRDSRTRTLLAELDQNGRIEEIARMLGGAEVTPLAKKHARELLRLSSKDEVAK